LGLAASELPKISVKKLVRDGKELVPSIGSDLNWKKKKPGIRAQLVNLQSNAFEMDFVVEKHGKFTHILNAVSPGWTSAIPFARYVVDKYLL
jgi:L-2-hydroxyglutarate oxidase LhgO